MEMVNKLNEILNELKGSFEGIVIGNELKGELKAMVEGKRIAMMIEDAVEEMVEMVGECDTMEELDETFKALTSQIDECISSGNEGIGIDAFNDMMQNVCDAFTQDEETYLEDDIEDLVEQAFEECDTVIQINGMEDALKNMIEDQATRRTRKVGA